jgi:4-hydroxy-tetrahydrodipicolinate reductase
MKIALIGYGKMGKAIEQLALKRGHEVILRIGRGNQHEFTKENLVLADVAIEFTTPESALENVIKCMDAGVPVICGSTGWNKQVYLAKEKCVTTNTAFLQASNFSVGVNIFFEINKRLASIMNDWPEYEVKVEETHHIEKKDAPSGTAITIAEQILENLKRKERWELDKPSSDNAVSIIAHREEHVPGTHTVTYSSAIDEIEIIHTAHSREGFATGAVLAAEFIQHRKGIFSMSDVLTGGA